MLSQLKGLLFKPSFTAILIVIILIYFVPSPFNKFEIKLLEEGLVSPTLDAWVYHADLDFDGNSERIVSFSSREDTHSIQILTLDGGTIDQWNFDGQINVGKGARLVTGDYDNDSLLEVYALYRKADSVFLDCIEPLDLIDPIEIKRIKMFELSHEFADSDCNIKEIFFRDINGDNNEEVIVSVSSGRARFPREIIVYDIYRDSVYRSPKIGVHIRGLQIADLDYDGKSELFGAIGAGGNVHDSLGVPYSDYSAWLMVFDHEFKFKFEPIEFPGFRSNVSLFPVLDSLILAYYFHAGPNKNTPEFFLLNVRGEILKRRQINTNKKSEQGLYVNSTETGFECIITERNNSKIYFYDDNFEALRTVDFGIPIGSYFKANLDEDMIEEQLFLGGKNEIIISKNDFKYLTKYRFSNSLEMSRFSVVKSANHSNVLYIQDGDRYYMFLFGKNPFAPFKYLVYLGLFILIWLFILLINKMQLIRIEKKNQIRHEIVNLQLKNIKNQMNPHFTFNVFNTIASVIKKESPQAYESFMKFTALIRSTLESSDKITLSIEDELEYIRNYLELEKLRFKKEFDYKIEINEDVNQQTKIPKMLLQTYAENAIKHGLRYRKSKGKLVIKIKRSKNYYEFEVIDDGIGREKAKQVSTDSTGFGLKIMESYFKLFNEYNNQNIKQKIIDLYDINNEAAGTKVIVQIPVNFKYNLRKNEE